MLSCKTLFKPTKFSDNKGNISTLNQATFMFSKIKFDEENLEILEMKDLQQYLWEVIGTYSINGDNDGLEISFTPATEEEFRTMVELIKKYNYIIKKESE